VARKNVPPAHFGYMASGLDDEVTLRANREGFLKFQLNPHRLNDVSKVDTSVELFGTMYDSPIFVCPTGGNQFFHPDGEVAVAKAARAGNHLQILSMSSNYSEEVTKARGGADLVPTLCVAELGGSAGADQAGRCRRLSGPYGDDRPYRGPKPGNLVPADAHRYARMFGVS
jgi:isopentenyl diphosphate isomerase/L-lactate dehydrogenase-like FMN-dependent dehydrogenase